MKKSRTIDWRRPVLIVAAWVVRLHHLTYVVAAFIPLLLLAAWLDPQRPRREQDERAEAQSRHARQEARLLAQAQAEPPTGRLDLNFQKLGFYLPPDARWPLAEGKGFAPYLPAGIQHYDGRDVRIQGYMLPTKLEQGRVKECLVLANQMGCCFGQEPRFCEFIAVRMQGRRVPEQMDQPLRFDGKLHIGDVFENGTWVALYSMDCTAVNP